MYGILNMDTDGFRGQVTPWWQFDSKLGPLGQGGHVPLRTGTTCWSWRMRSVVWS